MREFAFACRKADGEHCVGKSLLQRWHHASRRQHVGRTRGKRNRLWIMLGRGKLWVDQHQIGEPHGFHGARGATDVAGMRRLDQHHANSRS